jgi:hypothetical protein
VTLQPTVSDALTGSSPGSLLVLSRPAAASPALDLFRPTGVALVLLGSHLDSDPRPAFRSHPLRVTAARPLPLRWSSGRGRADGARHAGPHHGGRAARPSRSFRVFTRRTPSSILSLRPCSTLSSPEDRAPDTPKLARARGPFENPRVGPRGPTPRKSASWSTWTSEAFS